MQSRGMRKSHSELVSVSLSRDDLPLKPKPPKREFDVSIIPILIPYLGRNEKCALLRCSWHSFKLCSEIMYRHVEFGQLSGSRLRLFIKTLQKTILTKDSTRESTLDYSRLVVKFTALNVVFDGESPLQQWTDVKEALFLLSRTLKELEISIGDESFNDLPSNFRFLEFGSLPNLCSLEISSKCHHFPNSLAIELLSTCPDALMRSIKLKNCLSEFTLSDWELIVQKGGLELQELSLTPSRGPNVLGWDESSFENGLHHLVSVCVNLLRLDLSGHCVFLRHDILELLLMYQVNMEEFYMPCTSNDTHLLIFLKYPPWRNLKALSIACHCVDGEKEDLLKNGIPCTKFTDSVLESLLFHMLEVETYEFHIFLPANLISVKTGHRISTLDYMSRYTKLTRRVGDVFWFQERISLSVHTNRLISFL